MGVYVLVKLHDGTVLGEMEITREEDTGLPDPGMDFEIYHYRYRLKGRDPVSKAVNGYQGTVEHERCDWVWTLVGKVLNDRNWK